MKILSGYAASELSAERTSSGAASGHGDIASHRLIGKDDRSYSSTEVTVYPVTG